jgi:hypothetical protein
MMQRVLKNKWQEDWVSAMLVLLFAGLLVSRALVSLASVAMLLPFLFSFKQRFVDHKYIWAIGLILLPVIISGLWSNDKTLWWNSVSVKLPLLTMMLGLITTPLSKQRWMQVAWSFVIIISLGCCWSLFQYALNLSYIQAAYLQAKVMATPSDNDHIRFSWMVIIAIVLGIRCLKAELHKAKQFVLSGLLISLVLYLHILASKTGLVCLYLGAFIYLCDAILIKKNTKAGIGILLAISAVAFICYTQMPTLRNRIRYVLYDFENYSKGNFMPGYNDAARWLSIKAGYQITNENPLSGVGFGDMLSTVDQWHQKNHPNSFDYERFLPANEWLVYGTGSGWPGMICFSFGFILLLFYSTKKNIESVVLTVVSIFPFLIDDTLEGQYGVVLLAFIAFFGQQKITEQIKNT